MYNHKQKSINFFLIANLKRDKEKNLHLSYVYLFYHQKKNNF